MTAKVDPAACRRPPLRPRNGKRRVKRNGLLLRRLYRTLTKPRDDVRVDRIEDPGFARRVFSVDHSLFQFPFWGFVGALASFESVGPACNARCVA
jgi:hypothetical protein